MFSYYITTHFITNNKYYNSYRNLHSVYQTYPRSLPSKPDSNEPSCGFSFIKFEQLNSIHKPTKIRQDLS